MVVHNERQRYNAPRMRSMFESGTGTVTGPGPPVDIKFSGISDDRETVEKRVI